MGFSPSGGLCPGLRPQPANVNQIKAAVFAENAPAGATTVGSIFNECSYNRTMLTAANSRIAQPVKLPCSGTK